MSTVVCEECKGFKKARAAGLMNIDCPYCKGVGHVKSKADIKNNSNPIVDCTHMLNDEINENIRVKKTLCDIANNPKKIKGRPKKVNT